MENSYHLTLNIHRYDPDTKRAWVQEYRIEAGRVLRFVDLFRQINAELDPTLAWSSSCEHGQCGSCSIVVNGKPLLACELLIENAVDYFKTTTFNIQPIRVAPIVRDLVVDIEKAYERVNRAKPYIIKAKPLPETGQEYSITPGEIEHYVNATRCINCFCCSSACISSHESFVGPNAILASIVRVMDPREAEKNSRIELLYGDEGVKRCHTSQACSFVCPKEIDVSHFIALAKQGRLNLIPKERK